jgi:triacylglycerol lipase
MSRTTILVIIAAILGIVGYGIYIAVSPPGGEDTVDEDDRPGPKPLVVGPLEPLRMTWDSEANADWPVAELLASMSESSYEPPVDVDPVFRKLGFTQVMAVVDSSMIGYVASVGDVTVVVFRGTDNDVDWIVNLVAGSAQTPKGRIHKGFYNAYQPLKPQIVKLVKAANSKHLWITGHSLGGALAVVCAYDLIENEKLDVDGVITFGQPMVAKPELAGHLDSVLLGRFAHYVNRNDIVARVPPNFSHCGSLVWFTDSGVKRSKPKRLTFGATGDEPPKANFDEPKPLSDREFENLKAELRSEKVEVKRSPDGTPIYEGNSTWVQDHGMEFYLEKIRGVSKGSDAGR